MRDYRELNLKLSLTLLLTCIGDWLSYFSILVWTDKLTHDLSLAIFATLLKAIATAISSALFPSILTRFECKKVLAFSQLFSALLIAALLLLYLTHQETIVWAIFLIFFIQAFFSQSFYLAREAYSHALVLESGHSGLIVHSTVQAIVEKGIAFAQVIGPLLFFLLSILFQERFIAIAFCCDIVSFLISAYLFFQGADLKIKTTHFKLTNAVAMLQSNLPLREVFLIRSVFLIIPVWLGNFLLFNVLQERYNLGIIAATLPYALIGLGRHFGNLVLAQGKKATSSGSIVSKLAYFVRKYSSPQLLNISSIGLGISFVGYSTGIWQIGAVSAFLYGISNSFQITLSRAQTKVLCGTSNVAEVFALDGLIGQTTAIIVYLLFYGTRASTNVGTVIILISSLLTGLLFQNAASIRGYLTVKLIRGRS